MFGYIRPYVPEMKVAEWERFRALYCGVCRAMGKRTGQLSRLTLSYDYVFLAAVRMAVSERKPVFAMRRCAVHPLRKRKMAEDDSALSYTAAAAAEMLWEKCLDDRADETGFRRLLGAAGVPVAGSFRRRAERRKSGLSYREGECLWPDAGEIRRLTEGLYRLEAAESDSMDETAEAFGAVLGYVFSEGLSGNGAVVAREIGRAAGRFVYLCDAAEDAAEDMRRGRYNPICRAFGDLALSEKTEPSEDGGRGGGRAKSCGLSPLAAESVRIAAGLDLSRLGLAAELLPEESPWTPIVKNIVYLGMPAALDAILKKKRVGGLLAGKERVDEGSV